MIRLRFAMTVSLALSLTSCVRLAENYPLPPIDPNTSYNIVPGDVVYLTTWVNTDRSGGKGGTYPSLTVQEPITFRTVAAGKMLRPNEAALLGATLATIRSVRHSDDYLRLLSEHEALLWNAFLAGLKVRRNAAGLPELAFRAKDACDALDDDQYGLKLFFSPDDATEACPLDEREVRGVQAQPGSLYSITVTDKNLTGQSYADPNPTSGRAEVYRAGASMWRPKAGEERWTLAEWQMSGICAAPDVTTQIDVIKLKKTPYSMRVTADGRNSVRLDERGRRGFLPPARKRPLDTITTESLGYLFPDDVEFIRWREPVPEMFKEACKSR